jgi:hypothetical protein
MMYSETQSALVPTTNKGNERIERTRKLRPAFHTQVKPPTAKGIVAVAALWSSPSCKQPQLTRIVVPLDEREEVMRHRSTALVTLQTFAMLLLDEFDGQLVKPADFLRDGLDLDLYPCPSLPQGRDFVPHHTSRRCCYAQCQAYHQGSSTSPSGRWPVAAS